MVSELDLVPVYKKFPEKNDFAQLISDTFEQCCEAGAATICWSQSCNQILAPDPQTQESRT